MSDTLAHIRRIVSAATPEAVWTELAASMRVCGFDRLLYGATRNRRDSSVGDIQDAVCLSTLDLKDTRGIGDLAFFMRTPMFRWVMTNQGACSWSWTAAQMAAGLLSEDERKSAEQARRVGLTAGYVISFEPPQQRRAAALSLIAPVGTTQEEVDAIWDRRGEEIQLMAQTMHLKLQAMPMLVQRRALSPRQREALEWVAEGKTSQDIAVIMGISPGMVEKHLRLARETLDVETTAQAVAKATMFNHLYASPDGHT